MLKPEDKLTTKIVDEIATILEAFEARPTWDGEKHKLIEYIKKLLIKQKYKLFTGDCRDYHLSRKGQTCIYRVPKNQSGFLRSYRGVRVRLVCLGGWDGYSGRWFYVAEV